jgi:hypothetical protein
MKTEARPSISAASNALDRGDPIAAMPAVQQLPEFLPAALYTCDAPAGRITFYNSNAAKLWGRTPRQLDNR